MSFIIAFARKSSLAIIILVLLTSGLSPHRAYARRNSDARKNTSEMRSQDRRALATPLNTNLIRDPGFEASYKSPTGPWFQYWDRLDTICVYWDVECDKNGAGYVSGGAWAGFGVTGNSVDSVYQNVIFPGCGARLDFYLYIGLYFGPGQAYGMNNYFAAAIDGIPVFEVFGSQYESYQLYIPVSLDVSAFADGGLHRVEFFSDNLENFLWFNLDEVGLYATNPASECADVTVSINQTPRGSYVIPRNTAERIRYPVEAGPVIVNSNNNFPLVASERVAYHNGTRWTHFSEMIGLPDGLKSTGYAFPAYDNIFFDSQLRFGNVGNANTTVTVIVGGAVKGTYTLTPNQSRRVSYAGLSAGPVVIQSSNGVPIIASLRVVTRPSNGSYSEIMGLPRSQWGNSFVFPWYNNVELNTQLRVANVGASATTVTVTIRGTVLGTFNLARNASHRINFNGRNNGPLKVTSSGGVPIVASARIAFNSGNTWTSFSEMMGLPESELDNEYVLPWYNNRDLDTQLRFANVSNSATTVRVYIGGQEMPGSPFALAAGASIRRSFPDVDRGPVVIRSTNGAKIIAALRILFKTGNTITSFSELMGLPEGRLAIRYIFPYYNNVGANTQLRIGIP